MTTPHSFIEMTLLGSAGAISVEVLKAYELRAKLHAPMYAKIRKSPFFWLATLAFIGVSGFLTWAFNEGNATASIAQLVATGAGSSAILKKISEALAANRSLSAGDDDLFEAMFR